MKTLSFMLAAVMIMHLQCGGSCLSESLQAAQPPCHQHGSAPSKTPQVPHDANSPCTQGPLIESQFMAVLPVTIQTITLIEPISRTFTTHDPSGVWSPPIPLSILRI